MLAKPCPFCGAAMVGANMNFEAGGRWQSVICGACGARGPEVLRHLPNVTAVEAWNRRPVRPLTVYRPCEQHKHLPAQLDTIAVAALPVCPHCTPGVKGDDDAPR